LRLGTILEADARLISRVRMQSSGSQTRMGEGAGLSLSAARTSRLSFIDLTRGLVIVLMAWDHVCGFWNQVHGGLEGIMPARNPALDTVSFLSRFITHWCAPTFVFLAGSSLALSTAKRLGRGESQRDVTLHILKRGLVLVALEWLIVSPAFDLPPFNVQVMACIGFCFVVFSVLRLMPASAVLGASLIVVLNRQWLDLGWIPSTPIGVYIRALINEPLIVGGPSTVIYPVLPWLGVMGLGWVFGVYLAGLEPGKVAGLKRPLALVGAALIVLFILVRYFNGYGNLVRRWSDSLFDWLYVSKYPPDVAFLLWTLGGMCLFLVAGMVFAERGWLRNRVVAAVGTLGRVPLFFYVAHLWLYRLRLPGQPPPFYLDLPQTAVVWLAGLLVLWLACSRYEVVKGQHPRLLQYL
jgi:uncharacterized membrane protein